LAEAAVRGGGGTVFVSIRRRRAEDLDRPPRAAPHRRSDGAPASPRRYCEPREIRWLAQRRREDSARDLCAATAS